MDNAQDLFEHELRDIYDADRKLVRATESMAKKVKDPKLSKALNEHSKVTQGQVSRLEKVFADLGRKPRREACDGINGLISEFQGFVKERPAPEVMDFFAIGAASKVEHYEIEAYKSLITLAKKLGLGSMNLLQDNLVEEQEAASELEAMSSALAGRLPSNGS